MTVRKVCCLCWAIVASVCLGDMTAWGQEQEPHPLIGRWDLVVKGEDGDYPSWLEVRKSGYSTLVGSFVGQFGSARPIAEIKVDGESFSFAIPKQWEDRQDHLTFQGECHVDHIDGDHLHGKTTDNQGRQIKFSGVRAPSLKRESEPTWGEPVELFNGQDLSGWKPLLPNVPNGWTVNHGLLVNAEPGNNIATSQTFDDFKLHVEFRYPAGSNSGIYLRGRHELQIEDNFGDEPESHKVGGIYGFLTPSVNAAKAAGEWQTYDIELVGRTITVHLNGQRVIDRQDIPGITGGALDSAEGEPGPIYLQGDHGPVEFRKITITPAQ
ncbi:MAG: DUF1080 domain-containing protein [Pirellulaceae bacterium]